VTLFGVFLTPVFFFAVNWVGESRLLSSHGANVASRILLELLTLGIPRLIVIAARRSPEPSLVKLSTNGRNGPSELASPIPAHAIQPKSAVSVEWVESSRPTDTSNSQRDRGNGSVGLEDSIDPTNDGQRASDGNGSVGLEDSSHPTAATHPTKDGQRTTDK
jgi:hypothetical protein